MSVMDERMEGWMGRWGDVVKDGTAETFVDEWDRTREGKWWMDAAVPRTHVKWWGATEWLSPLLSSQLASHHHLCLHVHRHVQLHLDINRLHWFSSPCRVMASQCLSCLICCWRWGSSTEKSCSRDGTSPSGTDWCEPTSLCCLQRLKAAGKVVLCA